MLKNPPDTLRQAQGERKSAGNMRRGTAHAEPVEAWGGVFQHPADRAIFNLIEVT
jgi:hypothetical protein